MINLEFINKLNLISMRIKIQGGIQRQYLFGFCMLIFILFNSNLIVHSQEIRAKVTVSYGQIGNTVDKKVFQTLQTSLLNFTQKNSF